MLDTKESQKLVPEYINYIHSIQNLITMSREYNAYKSYDASKRSDPAITFDQHLLDKLEIEMQAENNSDIKNTYNIIQVLSKDKLFSRLSNESLIAMLRCRLLLDDESTELQDAINKMASN